MKFKHSSVRSDYAIAKIGSTRYYFGYEVIYCPTCNSYYRVGNTCDCDDDLCEWAFEAKNIKTGSVKYMRAEDYDWEDMGDVLLELIARYKESNHETD